MSEFEHRVLIYAPRGRDAAITERILKEHRIPCECCDDVRELVLALQEGAGAIITTWEALDDGVSEPLARALSEQPAWSEVPVLVFAPETKSERTTDQLGPRANVTLLDRPVHIKTLMSVVKSALRTRNRQYEIRGLMQSLEQRLQERDRFLAILGHELRNPLSAILLASQMTEPEGGTLAGEHARMIERQARHLTRLVNDLLDLSRVASGKIVIKPEAVDLGEITGLAVDALRDTAQSQQITMHFQKPAKSIIVDADGVRVDQIIGNLLSNAIKYTPEGGQVEIALREEGEEAVIDVKDTGVGIDPQRINDIFELFAQAENSIGRSQGGMGIGLALVRNLVELHGGSVSAWSDGDGKGSTFTVRLPRSSAQVAVKKEEKKPASSRGARRIVIVEDNPDVGEILRLRLARLGHHVSVAHDGAAGVEAVIQQHPDLALIDIGLPGMDGYEVAKRIRAEVNSGIVLVAVTGFGQQEDKRKAMAAGFDDHLTKPADISDIEELLDRFPPRANGSNGRDLQLTSKPA